MIINFVVLLNRKFITCNEIVEIGNLYRRPRMSPLLYPYKLWTRCIHRFCISQRDDCNN